MAHTPPAPAVACLSFLLSTTHFAFFCLITILHALAHLISNPLVGNQREEWGH